MAAAVERVATDVWKVQAIDGGGQAKKKNIVLYAQGRLTAKRLAPFLMMAEDWVENSGGFEMHPHRGFETVTMVYSGQLRHRDTRGGAGRLGAGGCQWMTAGRGIQHEEMATGNEDLHATQLWLNLPASVRGIGVAGLSDC